MTFLDRKEEVINVELTQYGKYLLSLGKFKPTFYEFFDDDIVYDSKFIGVTETQSSIQTRIKETSRTKVQYSFSGADTQMKRNIELIRSHEEKNLFSDRFLPTAEKHYSLSAPLGSSDISSDKAPAWNINFLKGKIASTLTHTTGSHTTINTPRITVETVIFETFPTKVLDGTETEINIATKKFEDGSFIQIKDDFILIDLKEENTPLRSDKFDIEVYLLDKDFRANRGDKENLIPLFFDKKKEQVVNNILVEDKEEASNRIFGPSFVEHYFNVFVDREINPDTLCSVLSEEEIIALAQTSGFNFECVKKQPVKSNVVSDVTEDDLNVEKC